jgi:hypothetical protein
MVIVMIKRDDWAAYEYACEMVEDIRKRLKAGGEGSGVTLTPDDCDLVLGNLRYPSPPNSRPARNWYEELRAIEPIARYCRDLEKNMSLKNAVADTEKRFDCKRSTVYAARKAFPSK